jgi:hypothetical protein
MKGRNEESADFGRDDVEVEDGIEDEIVPDEIPEEENPLYDEHSEDETEEGDGSDDDEPSKEEPKKRDKAQTRINQLQRERYRAINQAEKAAADAEHWRQQYELMKQMSTRFYDADVNSRLEKAKSAHIAATESGDAQAQAEASVEMASAAAELQNLNKAKYQEQYERDTRPYPNFPPPEAQNVEVVNEWLQENHEWKNPTSKSYDRELDEYIKNVDANLGKYCRENGRQSEIGNSDYFQILDAYKEDFLSNRNKSPNQNRELNMRQSRGGASPVRNSSPTQQRSSRQEYKLSAQERELARASGVDEDKFMKEKIKFMREEAMNGGRR